jgi:hypothetical protein
VKNVLHFAEEGSRDSQSRACGQRLSDSDSLFRLFRFSRPGRWSNSPDVAYCSHDQDFLLSLRRKTATHFNTVSHEAREVVFAETPRTKENPGTDVLFSRQNKPVSNLINNAGHYRLLLSGVVAGRTLVCLRGDEKR